MPAGRVPRRGLPACTASVPASKTRVEARRRRRREGAGDAGAPHLRAARRAGAAGRSRGKSREAPPGVGCYPRPGARPLGGTELLSAHAALFGDGRGGLGRFASLGGRVIKQRGLECARSRTKVRYWQMDDFLKRNFHISAQALRPNNLKKKKKVWEISFCEKKEAFFSRLVFINFPLHIFFPVFFLSSFF